MIRTCGLTVRVVAQVAAYGQQRIMWPGFTEGGFSWFTDLSRRIPYYILPVVSAASMLTTLEVCSCSVSSFVCLWCLTQMYVCLCVQLGSEGVKMDQMGGVMKNVMHLAVISADLASFRPYVQSLVCRSSVALFRFVCFIDVHLRRPLTSENRRFWSTGHQQHVLHSAVGGPQTGRGAPPLQHPD